MDMASMPLITCLPVVGFVIMAQTRLAQRHAGRPARSDTLLSTVTSIKRSDFPTRASSYDFVDPPYF
jgi:hypothetical protein